MHKKITKTKKRTAKRKNPLPANLFPFRNKKVGISGIGHTGYRFLFSGILTKTPHGEWRVENGHDFLYFNTKTVDTIRSELPIPLIILKEEVCPPC